MKIAKMMMIAGTTALLSTTAPAATIASVKNLPNGGNVTLTGTVEDFDSAHSFTLRDTSGTVKVDLSSAKSVVLKDGETVSISGVVDAGILGTKIAASSVSVDKGVGEQVGEAIDSVTGQDAAGSARTVNIQSLPASGLIKVNGMVDSVDSEKRFTLKDSTGQVDVNIKSDESASLGKGTEVTVIGYAGKGILGKDIDATEVDVRSSSLPVANE